MRICRKSKPVNDSKTVNEPFAYLDLLDDNTPKAFPEYDGEARILKKQIDNPSVRNIAVVAKYGAGKSSVINTYLCNHRNGKGKKKGFEKLDKPENNQYARITLSTFNSAKYDESDIERSILQQLLYSRNKTEFPNSAIKRTYITPKWHSWGVGFLVTIFIIASVLFGMEVTGTHMFAVEVTLVKYSFLGIAAVTFLALAFNFIHYQKFSRIKYQDFEVDVHDDDSKADTLCLINKFIDEVLYFFECVDIDLVIFEDLDRLPTPEIIFTKLRELNTVINGSRKRDGKVTFLYAVKNDLFKTEEERAKFFDFILPVVPIINPVTTDETLRGKVDALVRKNAKMRLHDRFIKGISGYIPDMRILKNTFNDYVIMFNKIIEDKHAGKDLSPEKLFALCLYKNLFPSDYALLEKNDGLIPRVINMTELRKKCVKSTENELSELKEKLQKLQGARVTSFAELKALFYGQIAGMPKGNGSGNTDALTITTFEGLNFSSVKHPIITLQGTYYQNQYHVIFHTVTLPKGQTEIRTPSGERYIDVENTIKEREQNGIGLAQKRIEELEKQKLEMQGRTFAEIIAKEGVDFCAWNTLKEEFLTKAVEEDDKKIGQEGIFAFLRFLVANDYIDEHYLKYTSNYKALSITSEDFRFVMSVQRHEQNFEYVPDNISGVVARLGDVDFKHTSALNKKLLESMEEVKLISKSENSKKFENFVNLLADTTKADTFTALRKYVQTSDKQKCEALLKIVIPQRPTFCAEILTANELTVEKKDIVFVCTIKYGGTNYRAENIENRLSEYISGHSDYLGLFNSVGDEGKVIKFLAEVVPCFKKLSKDGQDGAIQRDIVANWRYHLTLENLEIIFGIENASGEKSDFYTKNYDVIISSDKLDVAEYVSENLNHYAKTVLLNPKVSCANEPLDRMTFLVKTTEIDIETKKEIIKKSKVKFADIMEFDEALFVTLFDNDSVEPTWANVLYAFEKKGLECVKTYLIRHKKIDGKFIEGEKGSENHTKFLQALVCNVTATEIDDIAKTMSVDCPVTLLTKTEVADDVLAAFIGAGKVKFENTDLTTICSKPKSLCAYLKKHDAKITENLDAFFDCALPQQNTQTVQVSKNINGIQQRVNEQQISYSEKANANAIIAAVLACIGTNAKTKKFLVEKCAPIIQISGHEKIYSDFIINERGIVSADVLWQFASSTISANEKLTILDHCNYGGILRNAQKIKAFLLSVGEPYTELFGNKKNARIEINDNTGKLLPVLKEVNLIVHFRKSPSRDEYNVVAV